MTITTAFARSGSTPTLIRRLSQHLDRCYGDLYTLGMTDIFLLQNHTYTYVAHLDTKNFDQHVWRSVSWSSINAQRLGVDAAVGRGAEIITMRNLCVWPTMIIGTIDDGCCGVASISYSTSSYWNGDVTLSPQHKRSFTVGGLFGHVDCIGARRHSKTSWINCPITPKISIAICCFV